LEVSRQRLNEFIKSLLAPEKAPGSDCAWLHSDGQEVPPLSLHECVEAFERMERLGEDNMWYCNVCKKHQRATKKIDLWRLPRILVVHLKRFVQTDRYSRSKCEYRVNYPHRAEEALVLSNHAKQEHQYSFFAMSKHMGGLSGGHYTAQVKCKLRGSDGVVKSKWCHFNDTYVTEGKEPEESDADAYLLFYEQKSI